jgi:hypothetical protein
VTAVSTVAGSSTGCQNRQLGAPRLHKPWSSITTRFVGVSRMLNEFIVDQLGDESVLGDGGRKDVFPHL